jgi:hypothetical protein
VKIVFSRKGFDTGSGGCPSPILAGVPVSLPIPSGPSEPFRYQDLNHPVAGNLGEIVARTTKGRIDGTRWAHADPVLPHHPDPAALGQQGAAQAHLENQGVGPGDAFVFFGLFRAFDAPSNHPDRRPHHRIFGMLRVSEMHALGENPDADAPALLAWRTHPHVHRKGNGANNTLWTGVGQLALSASPALRLTRNDATGPSDWTPPAWLLRHRMSYHANPDRWSEGSLRLVARGQEFVSDVGCDPAALAWLEDIKAALSQPST